MSQPSVPAQTPASVGRISPQRSPRRSVVCREAGQRQSKLRNGKESREAAALELDLNTLLDRYRKVTPLRETLMEAIAQVHTVATRDRKSDRDAVFRAIFDQGCREIPEIVEDTRLTPWIVKGVVEELVMNDLVEVREKFRPGGRPEGEVTLEYHPLHVLP